MTDLDAPLAWLGGRSPRRFMRSHWQKRPLLVRSAWPMGEPALDLATLRALAARDDVESRLVEHRADGWRLRHGPLPARALPPQRRSGWTLLVQGVDLHVPAAHAMRRRFDFVPQARLDDVMVSWASEGGGVGPHVDSYDVFLLQLGGRRRWRVGRVADPAWQPDQPLRLLQRFDPAHDWLVEPGDLLYLPPGWGHDGVAEGGPCTTASIGFRAPARDELARALLARLADRVDDDPRLYADPDQPATDRPGAVPDAMVDFAADVLARTRGAPARLRTVLGEWLTEPKADVWFNPPPAAARRPRDRGRPALRGVRLDARSRMLYHADLVFLNGESWRAVGADRRLLHALADTGRLGPRDRERLGSVAAATLDEWLQAGWLLEDDEMEEGRR